jgi:ABC-type transport system involved in multi-copper enzyme maturation permease subunit
MSSGEYRSGSPSARTIWLLAAKDLWQQRLFIPLLSLFQIASAAIMFAQAPRVPVVVATVFQLLCWVGAFVLCFRSVISEEKNRGLVFLATLPISRLEIALAKFLSNALMVTITLVIFGGALALASAAGYLTWPTRDSGLALATFATLTFLASAFFLAVALIGDSEKTIWAPFPLIWLGALLMGQSPRLSRRFSDVDVATLMRVLLLLSLFACAALAVLTAACFVRRKTIG